MGVLAPRVEHLRDGRRDLRVGSLADGVDRRREGLLRERVGHRCAEQARRQRDVAGAGQGQAAGVAAGLPAVVLGL